VALSRGERPSRQNRQHQPCLPERQRLWGEWRRAATPAASTCGDATTVGRRRRRGRPPGAVGDGKAAWSHSGGGAQKGEGRHRGDCRGSSHRSRWEDEASRPEVAEVASDPGLPSRGGGRGGTLVVEGRRGCRGRDTSVPVHHWHPRLHREGGRGCQRGEGGSGRPWPVARKRRGGGATPKRVDDRDGTRQWPRPR
jgi:hypothetical protein